MTVTTIVLTAVLGALGLTLVAGVGSWVLSRGAETLSQSADLTKKQHAQLIPKWLIALYIVSALFRGVLTYYGMEELELWVMVAVFAVGMGHYGMLIKNHKQRSVFRRQAWFLFYGFGVALLLSLLAAI